MDFLASYAVKGVRYLLWGEPGREFSVLALPKMGVGAVLRRRAGRRFLLRAAIKGCPLLAMG